MIQTNAITQQLSGPAIDGAAGWQRELARGFSQPPELLAFLGLADGTPGLPAPAQFPLRVTRSYAARMRRGDPADPLFLQVWASPEETRDAPGFQDDAVGDLARTRPGGLLHKYQGRALVIATGACAVHCRYCFRRHFPYGELLAARDHWREALREIASDDSLAEIILSGGDPLALPDAKLAEFAEALEFIPHVRRLRIHTRLPVVLPQRVDDALLGWLGRGRVSRVMVLHFNHANELDAETGAALRRLAAARVPLLNQSVLLRRVNDSVDALARLSETLFESGVMPYYLHMLDRVRGTAHFEVPEPEARALRRALAERLPGYLVPRLVRETAGAPAKIPLPW